jgi:hypothetical protein
MIHNVDLTLHATNKFSATSSACANASVTPTHCLSSFFLVAFQTPVIGSRDTRRSSLEAGATSISATEQYVSEVHSDVSKEKQFVA